MVKIHQDYGKTIKTGERNSFINYLEELASVFLTVASDEKKSNRRRSFEI